MPCHHYRVFETPAGFCAIAWSEAGISRLQLPMTSADAAERMILRRLPHAAPGIPSAEIKAAIEAVRRYFAGASVEFSALRLDLAEQDAFFREIYSALRKVGWGETTSYGALAKAIGAGPDAARRVGQAMANNPIPLIIPCHRVLAAGGRLGGFSAPGGSDTKVRMLELEGVRLGARDPSQQAFAF
ncbi:methylated-DNA--[protein]-cysteine S-methyltransferase [Pseudorhizobium halotolerans]|uniref:Methylated-DNA--[protein]-cysteine S-methyltransferase n=1 Tax=Pseudorhizobium halotolerans TaxID=1233081 RepID=A0ABM8PR47_9HYPH|nr:methylated-DNA--[protein]-cysteine S-methyltransferase [Pseudorhizobium halotolerans]